ncbi:MAG: hypothetical protein LBG97_07775 [Coriobacteriales bacterium]|jgi:glucose-1-phosphate thymidylyltransferase|nr:hypothetical protein [Coriobacteriales bacterium]
MQTTKCGVIGLIPAGGRASRFGGYPIEKELLPIPARLVDNKDKWVMIDDTLMSFIESKVNRVVIIVNENKIDLVRHVNRRFGFTSELQIEYIFQNVNCEKYGLPYAIEMASYIIEKQTVVLRFPDTLITSKNYLDQLLRFHHCKNSELTLGVFQPQNLCKFLKNSHLKINILPI